MRFRGYADVRGAYDSENPTRSTPATAQHTTGAQCSSGAGDGSLSAPLAVVAIRAKVASASAENSTPVVLPSAPV